MNRERLLGLLLGISAVAGLGISLHLFLLTRSVGGIAGCGDGGCGEVLGSRWSVFFGVPVSLFGAVAYLGLLGSLTRRLEFLQIPLSGMIGGAIAWFIVLQAFVLRDFCAWCMASHGAGLGVVGISLGRARSGGPFIRRWIAGAVAGLLTLGLGQTLGPGNPGFRVDAGALPKGAAVGEGILFPRLGPEKAEVVLVEYFHYGCPACRVMSGYLDKLMAAHPGRVSILLMPVPPDSDGNPGVSPHDRHHGACETARIALAVWLVRPREFEAFHRQLMEGEGETPSRARALALAMMSAGELRQALADPRIERSIRANIETWKGLSSDTDRLPKLIVGNRRVLHGLPPSEAGFFEVMSRETPLHPASRRK
jgi:uncharacterized membrane protein